MKFLVISALVSAAVAFPQGYTPPTGFYDQAPAPAPTYVAAPVQHSCGAGEVRKGDGSCARPIVTRNLYLYNAPAQKTIYNPPTHYPEPKVHYNFVFVRTADGGAGPRPIVAPAPQQKTLVYLLSKRPEDQQQEVIEVPANPTKPEVFFVKYSDGENAQLPGGIDLQTALSQAAQQGQVIVGAGGAYGSSGGDVVHGGDIIHGGSIIHDGSDSDEHIFSGDIRTGGEVRYV